MPCPECKKKESEVLAACIRMARDYGATTKRGFSLPLEEFCEKYNLGENEYLELDDALEELQPAASALEEWVLDQYGIMCDCGKLSPQVVSIRTGFAGESANYCSECASKLVESLDKGDLEELLEEARREERWKFHAVLDRCKKAIELAIYSDDDLDGVQGQDVIAAIEKARAEGKG